MAKQFDARGGGRGYGMLVYGLLAFSALLIVIPFLYVILSSFSTKQEMITRGFFLIPREWTFSNYAYLLNNDNFMTAFGNAVYITVVGTVVNMAFTSLMAYGLSRTWLHGRKPINFIVLFTMVFAGGMIPSFLVVKSLGLLDSYWALFLSAAISPFNLIVMRSFFQNIPNELTEAGIIDGCGEWRMLVSIVIPLSLPAIATFTLFYAVHNWNTYFHAILYLQDSAKWPLQVFLRQLLIETDLSTEADSGGFEYGPAVKMAAVVVTAVPLLLVYPFLQKYFNQGMLLGSVKG
ncbi:carbohydrate ABC transporter permease [Paenibacillus sp. F411]|uniref:carbohydrate ABC transporter permease n=1 Tax=Paenibacillus sp. F411 TaxID=2820239 RepID=UPI001AAEAF85|nr:carbohydrate ABC transporter permease [Paenibacillus sp. F411]MBO2944377.1 carbohydrate ABC transporter permease [Paenibacillus sp. F411]